MFLSVRSRDLDRTTIDLVRSTSVERGVGGAASSGTGERVAVEGNTPIVESGHPRAERAGLAARAGVRVPILGTVTPGCEHYCPILAHQLDEMWPAHPPLYYALAAGRTAPYERVLPTDATAWTSVLLGGLARLRQMLGCSHVFLLLEDHVPLWRCDNLLLEELFRLALRENLRCVYFLMGEWPWESTEHRVESDGSVRGWPKIDVATIGGHRLARMPANDRHYNRCQPALWRVDDYLALLAEAVRSGIEDPWTFETFRLTSQPQHFVSGYRWPTRHFGYRKRGRVYLRALYSMEMPGGRRLRDELLRERFPGLPRRLRWALGKLFGFWGRLRGMPHRFGRRSTARARPA